MDDELTMRKALGHLAVSLGSWIVTIGTTYVVMRIATKPDYARTLVMRGALLGEQIAMAQARGWSHVADSCMRVYDKARPVGV